MNKKILTPIVAAVLILGFAFAANILYHSVPVDATISEALTSTTVSLSVSGYPGETISRDIIVDNAASVPLNTLVTWEEGTNANIVSYTTSMPITQTLSPGTNTITVTYTIATDSPTGTFNGNIKLERTA